MLRKNGRGRDKGVARGCEARGFRKPERERVMSDGNENGRKWDAVEFIALLAFLAFMIWVQR